MASWKDLLAIADRAVPGYRRAFLSAVESAHAAVDMAALRAALGAGNYSLAGTLVENAWQGAAPGWQQDLTKQTLGALDQSGVLAETELRLWQPTEPFVTKAGLDSYRFNMLDPRAIQWAKTQSATLVVNASAQHVAAIREIVGQSQGGAFTADKAARRIRQEVLITGGLGLDPRRAAGLAHFAARVSQATDKMKAAGATVKKVAAAEAKGQRAVARYRARLLRQRAETIARTESIAAACQGQVEAWMQAQDKGLLSRAVMKKWIVTPDDRLCPKCRAVRGQLRKVDQPFDVPGIGATMRPPAHPNCRCAIGITRRPAPKPIKTTLHPPTLPSTAPQPGAGFFPRSPWDLMAGDVDKAALGGPQADFWSAGVQSIPGKPGYLAKGPYKTQASALSAKAHAPAGDVLKQATAHPVPGTTFWELHFPAPGQTGAVPPVAVAPKVPVPAPSPIVPAAQKYVDGGYKWLDKAEADALHAKVVALTPEFQQAAAAIADQGLALNFSTAVDAMTQAQAAAPGAPAVLKKLSAMDEHFAQQIAAKYQAIVPQATLKLNPSTNLYEILSGPTQADVKFAEALAKQKAVVAQNWSYDPAAAAQIQADMDAAAAALTDAQKALALQWSEDGTYPSLNVAMKHAKPPKFSLPQGLTNQGLKQTEAEGWIESLHEVAPGTAEEKAAQLAKMTPEQVQDVFDLVHGEGEIPWEAMDTVASKAAFAAAPDVEAIVTGAALPPEFSAVGDVADWAAAHAAEFDAAGHVFDAAAKDVSTGKWYATFKPKPAPPAPSGAVLDTFNFQSKTSAEWFLEDKKASYALKGKSLKLEPGPVNQFSGAGSWDVQVIDAPPWAPPAPAAAPAPAAYPTVVKGPYKTKASAQSIKSHAPQGSPLKSAKVFQQPDGSWALEVPQGVAPPPTFAHPSLSAKGVKDVNAMLAQLHASDAAAAQQASSALAQMPLHEVLQVLGEQPKSGADLAAAVAKVSGQNVPKLFVAASEGPEVALAKQAINDALKETWGYDQSLAKSAYDDLAALADDELKAVYQEMAGGQSDFLSALEVVKQQKAWAKLADDIVAEGQAQGLAIAKADAEQLATDAIAAGSDAPAAVAAWQQQQQALAAAQAAQQQAAAFAVKGPYKTKASAQSIKSHAPAGSPLKQATVHFDPSKNAWELHVPTAAPTAAPPAPIPAPVVAQPSGLPQATTQWVDDLLKHQVAPAKGSNPGGLFEIGGQKFYVKLYADEGQAWSETIANRIYADLGAGAPQSAVVRASNGKLAYVSRWLDDVKGTVGKMGITDADAAQILDGFVADVLTANWDAVGTGLDNVVRLASGKVVRIDMGGSLLYRAQGALKPASVLSDIGEWETFLTRNSYYAQVFQKAGLSSADDLGQKAIAQIDRVLKLVKNPKALADWERYVEQASPGAPADLRKKVATMLRDRATRLEAKQAEIRALLAPPPPQITVPIPQGRFMTWDEALTVSQTQPGAGAAIPYDGGDIERLAVRARGVKIGNEDWTEVKFKLTKRAADAVAQNPASARLKAGQFKVPYEVGGRRGVAGTLDETKLNGISQHFAGDGVTFSADEPGLRIRFHRSTNASSGPYAYHNQVHVYFRGEPTEADFKRVLARFGVQRAGPPTAADVQAMAENAFVRLFQTGIDDLPPARRAQVIAAAKRDYGVSPADLHFVQGADGEPSIEFVEAAWRKIQAKTGVTHFDHSLSSGGSVDAVVRLLADQHGGLLATTTRMSEGVGTSGMSSTTDIGTGGADYVFVRQRSGPLTASSGHVVVKPDVLRRTDWFSYGSDTYGAQNPASGHGSSIRSRDNLRNVMARGGGQETMFRRIIEWDDVEMICVQPGSKAQIVQKLRAQGVTTVGRSRRPVEQILKER